MGKGLGAKNMHMIPYKSTNDMCKICLNQPVTLDEKNVIVTILFIISEANFYKQIYACEVDIVDGFQTISTFSLKGGRTFFSKLDFASCLFNYSSNLE